MVVVVGLTVILPGVATPPMPLSICALSALLTNPQLKVVELPAVMLPGDAVKDAIFGAPEQVAAGARVGAGAGGGTGGAMTLILTNRVPPKRLPPGVRIRQ